MSIRTGKAGIPAQRLIARALIAVVLALVVGAVTASSAEPRATGASTQWQWERPEELDENPFGTFVGTVTKVKSELEFDLRMQGKLCNVYAEYPVPRGLGRGDVVAVFGERVGKNDIRNAAVTVIDRR